MSEPLVLVAGATGRLGFQICEVLLSRGSRVRALVRVTSDPGRIGKLRELGADVVVGDLERPETLPAAVRGASAVVTTASSFPLDERPDAIDRMERAGSINLVDAAAASGVERFVYTSFWEIVPDFPFQQAKRAVEARLAASGLTYTVLRPASFMEVWFSPLLGFDLAAGKATVYGDGTEPLTWISTSDVARFAVWAIDAERARNATIDLGGPEALSQLEVIALHEELAEKTLARSRLTLDALEEMYADAAAPRERSLAAVMLNVAHGGSRDMRELCGASGIHLTSAQEFAARQLATA